MSKATPYSPDRYERVPEGWFRRCGASGLNLPAISFGLWHNFGDEADAALARRMCFEAFDLGITHFDLANNYGPAPGAAERRFATILKELPRDELIISTKAGYRMGPGPYGDGGSRKYLLSSIDASLRRLGLDYVDIFYHHRPDAATPLAETLGALESALRSGKALYAGISNYPGALTGEAVETGKKQGLSPLLIHQVSYSMFQRGPEHDLFPVTQQHGLGTICFCPLAQGMLTDRYLKGIPADSRAASKTGYLRPGGVKPQLVEKARHLEAIAKARGQSLAQMALAWVLRLPTVTSALIGASRPEQIRENAAALKAAPFSREELEKIEAVLGG